MEVLFVDHPLKAAVKYDLHPARAKQLYLQGIIKRVRPGIFEINPSMADAYKAIAFALLDLEGKYL